MFRIGYHSEGIKKGKQGRLLRRKSGKLGNFQAASPGAVQSLVHLVEFWRLSRFCDWYVQGRIASCRK